MADSVKIKIGADASEYKKTLEGLGKVTKAGMADIKAGIDLATQAMQKFASVAEKGISYNAQLEQMQTSFEVMTGSAEKAAEVVERLRTMGAETPFEMTDLASTTNLLMQYGFTADEAIDRMTMLGDIAQGNAEKMNSVALGYAQMSSAGKVNLVDIKQMINAGFNPLQEISERTGESMASLYDRISKGTISVDEITESMRAATSEGGKFYQSMEKQSQTLNGQLSTLKDNADQLLGSLTEGMSEELRDQILPFANEMISSLQEAYTKGGTQGLKTAATKMLRDMMGYLPTALRGAGAALPQVTTAFFEVATMIVTDLVAMLPELAPILLNGIVDLAGSVLNGAFSIIEGVFTGIEQAVHKGQKKIAGVWVDEANLAKYNFDVEINIEDAESEIETAYTNIRNALKTDLLTDTEKAEIIDMIGSDYKSVKDKLLSFGLTEEEAAPIAEAITTAGDTLIKAYSGLNVGIDATTLAKLTAQANGSRIVLKGLLKDVGLSDADIAQVTAVYDEMMGKVGEATPSIIEEIYDKLTDGKPDDAQTVSSLKEKITTYINGLLADLEAAYAAKSAELDVTAADYQEKKAALDEWYNSTKASITGMNTDMTTLVDTLAGAPTAVVQARMAEFVQMEQILLGFEEQINEMTAKARSAAENAFAVVRSGANADEATISTAIKFKVEEFKLDEQSAEDAYNAAVEKLNADLASGAISQEDYNTGIESAEADKQSKIQAAKAAYEKALSEIFAGIAESEGIENKAAETAEKIGLAETLMAIKDGLDDAGLVGDQLGAEMTQKLAEYMQIDPEILKAMPMESAKSALEDWALQLYTESTSSVEELDNTKLATAYASALEEGVLAGTKFDTTNTSEQIEALLIGIYQTGAENASPEVQAASESLVDDANEGAAGSGKAGTDRGDEFGSGYYSGIAGWIRKAYKKAKELAQAASQGAADGQESNSPSKAARRLGNYFGDGYDIGLQESMERAVLTAKRMSGQIVTSAEMSTAMRVNYSGLQQEIILANEQASTPVYLDGKQIAAIQGYNNSVQLAWDNDRSAKGVGRK